MRYSVPPGCPHSRTDVNSHISTLVTPYGDGADGGREATFDGPTQYGPEGARWHGYGVIQAKFLAKPGSSKSDGQWALKQLNAELAQFLKPDNRRKKPQYFIFATNVVLTPVAETGSKDLIVERLERFKASYGLVEYDIWDYDKLRIFLDRNEAVRRANAAWITAGDVLAELARNLRSEKRDYYRLISQFLQKELMADQYARLEQAGHSADEAIPLSQVFIDLPTASEPVPTDEISQPYNATEFVNSIVNEACHTFRVSADENLSIEEICTGRYVLIGGPGQGKTTLGQFACQIFRAAMLADASQFPIAPEARQPLAALQKLWASGVLPTPKARRLPFRVVLSEFAAYLATSETCSLIGFLATRMSKHNSAHVAPEEVEWILTEYPSLLVLDGLDEVPASTNRYEVLQAVSEFWVDVATAGMDVMVIATSRPQGYNDDFSPERYEHRYLVPLAPAKALEYGTRLAEVRFGSDPERSARVRARLEKAITSPATARLMRSPLQVTILTLLVDRIGHPPEERWALFKEYYKLIYQRETERDIPSVRILQEHSTEVHAIHRRVGLLLQIESEKAGGTEARLTLDQFSQMVEEYLREEGHEAEEIKDLKTRIIDAAGYRLVFLVGLEEGQVGFEIRSLQEFMAAEGLMEGDDGKVQDRLREVAMSLHWRNVFLFAAGRVFEERQYLRDTIESICFNMNDDPDDETMRLTLAGSELALDLLEDGPARRQPKKRGSLTRLALQLLQIPDWRIPQRLASVFLPATSPIYVQELDKYLNGLDRGVTNRARRLLAYLLDQDDEDIQNFGQTWIRDNLSKPDVFNSVFTASSHSNSWLADILFQELPKQNLGDIILRPERGNDSPKIWGPWVLADKPEWLTRLAMHLRAQDYAIPHVRSKPIKVLQAGQPIAAVNIPSTVTAAAGAPAWETAWNELPVALPSWAWVSNVERFRWNPSCEVLADLILSLKDTTVVKIIRHPNYDLYPWPLAECVDAVLAGADPVALAQSIRAGAYGDRHDWIQAETRWLDQGVDVCELLGDPLYVENGKPFLYGFPLRKAAPNYRSQRRQYSSLYEIYGRAESDLASNLFARIILGGGLQVEAFREVDIDRLEAVIDEMVFRFASSDWSATRTRTQQAFWQNVHAIDLSADHWNAWLSSRTAMLYPGFGTTQKNLDPGLLEDALLQKPQNLGLLVPLASLLPRSQSIRPELLALCRPINQDDPPAVKIAKMALLVHSGVDVRTLHSAIQADFENVRSGIPILTASLLRSGQPYAQIRDGLIELAHLFPNASIAFLGELRELLMRKRSRLEDRRVWRELGFPSYLLTVIDEESC